MISYDSATGYISLDGTIQGQGYSGHGEGINNPSLENVENVGPIPRGQYKIVVWTDEDVHLGPDVAILDPVPGTNTFGRSLFRIHGDNFAGDESASDGCIIQNRIVRTKLRESGDMDLEVV